MEQLSQRTPVKAPPTAATWFLRVPQGSSGSLRVHAQIPHRPLLHLRQPGGLIHLNISMWQQISGGSCRSQKVQLTEAQPGPR